MNQILYTGDEVIREPVKKQKKVLNLVMLFFLNIRGMDIVQMH